ncbi:hypothetical protein HYW58_01095 [Candidatus Kaiserbacteria bacterium]|nr:hypothetical protein [Candidatus Kaiserbacteria bacterium]
MMYRTYSKKSVTLLLIFAGMLLFMPIILFAQQETFVPLSPIPGVTSGTSFSGFLNAAFKIGLAAVAVFAVVWITYGGLEYMTTDSIMGKTSGKERIQNAIIGLLIALLIWVILYTINPNLLNFDIRVPAPSNSQSTQPRSQMDTTSRKGGTVFIPRGADTVDPGILGP